VLFRSSGDDVSFLEGCAKDVESGVKVTVKGIFKIGRALVTARDFFKGNDKAFGKWRQGRLPWLQAGTALNFIRAYEKFGSEFLPYNFYAVECYTPSLLYVLSAPSVPDSVVTEITTRIQSGERVKVKEVQEVIKQAKSKVVSFPTSFKPQSDLPIPAPKLEPIDMMPALRELGISKEWVSQFFYVYRDLDLIYKKHFSGQDRDVFIAAFAAALPPDMDLTCVYQLSDFLVKLITFLPSRKKGASHG
jgi:hypothetical protein